MLIHIIGECKMRKEYEKPEVERLSLVTEEKITNDVVDGDLGLESSIF